MGRTKEREGERGKLRDGFGSIALRADYKGQGLTAMQDLDYEF